MPIPAIVAVSGIVAISSFKNKFKSFPRGILASDGSRNIRLSPIPKGTILYHGTNSDEEFDVPDGPAWFSTSQIVAEKFSAWHGDELSKNRRIIKYRVRNRIPKIVNIESNMDMEAIIRKIERWEEELNEASPTEIAETLCSAGYNGWNIPNNYGHRQSDTMLCVPDNWLDLISKEKV